MSLPRHDAPVAIVTGAAGGIGQATAERLLHSGYRVALFDVDSEALDGFTDRIDPGKTLFVRTDVTSEESVRSSLAIVVEHFGAIDTLFNLVGGGNPGRNTTQVSLADWETVFFLTIHSVFLMCRETIPHLAAAKSGHIINLSSIAGVSGMHNSPAYCAAKGAVIAYTKALALDHGASGIRVNCVSPGAVRTSALRRTRTEQEIDAIGEAGTLLRRVAEPDEVAAVLCWLASDRSSYIVGQNVVMDGGASLC